MSLKKNLFLIYSVYFSRATVYLLLLPLLIRRLGDDWGAVAVSLSFIQIAATAIEFGFGVSATKRVARHRSSVSLLGQIIKSVALIQLMLFLVVCLVGIPLIYLPVLQQLENYVFLLLIILFQGISPLWFLRGVEDMLLISISEVISKIAVLALVYLFVREAGDAGNVYKIYFVGAFVPTLLGFIYIFRCYIKNTVSQISITHMRNQFKDGFIFFSVRLSGMFVSVGGSLMLGAAGHIKLAGLFAIAERILAGIRSILLPAWDVIFPKVIALLSDDLASAEKFRKKSIFMMILFSLLTSIALLIFAPYLVHYFSGDANSSAVFLVQIMSISPLFVSIINSLGLGYLVSHDRDTVFMLSIVSGFIIYFGYLYYNIFIISGDDSILHLLAYTYDFSLAVSMVMVIYFVKKNQTLCDLK